MRIIIYLTSSIVLICGASFVFPEDSLLGYALKALIIIISGSVAGFTFFRIWKPLRELSKKAEEVKNGALDTEFGSFKLKEFENITGAFAFLKKNTINAISFIKDIENGKLDVEYKGLMANGENGGQQIKGSDKLGESLVSLKDKLNEIAQSEKERNWVTEGMAKFVEILRANDEDLQSLSDKILMNLVHYLKANQGQLYILNDDNDEHHVLEMTAFYAYDRKKFVEKTVEIGQGLVGQAYQEKGTILLTEVPEDYVQVTSGLGEAPPRCILIVPLKINEIVYGIIEIASFQKYKSYEIEFVEKIGESIASTISNAKINHKTKALVEELQQQSEEMRAQEEEMRQNMEELQATQEEMARKEKEVAKLLEESNGKEKELAQKLQEIEKIQRDLELENAMFTGLMNVLSDRITIKDTRGAYLRINKVKADAFKSQGIVDYIGKTDEDFFGKEHYDKAMAEEQAIMDSKKVLTNADTKVKMPDGRYIWARTTKAPFISKDGKALGTLVITKDVSEVKECHEKLEEASRKIQELKSSKK